jgi:hypothetical protein
MDPTLDTFPTLTVQCQSECYSKLLEPLFLLQILMLCLSEYTTEYLLTTSVNDSLIVYLPSINIRSDLLYKSFNILATNPANSEWNYLGAGTSVGTANLPSTTFAMIMGTKGELVPMLRLSPSC